MQQHLASFLMIITGASMSTLAELAPEISRELKHCEDDVIRTFRVCKWRPVGSRQLGYTCTYISIIVGLDLMQT